MLRLSDVRVDGVRTPILQGGPEKSEEAIVFVHGNPGFSRDWEDLMERAGAFCRCVAPDMPGFGRSDRPEAFDYTVAGYARHLGGLLTVLQIRKAHLVLHDFGGPWGLAWALANPKALASLTLINTGVLAGYHWHYLARIWWTRVLAQLSQLDPRFWNFVEEFRVNSGGDEPESSVVKTYPLFEGASQRIMRRHVPTIRPTEEERQGAPLLEHCRKQALCWRPGGPAPGALSGRDQ